MKTNIPGIIITCIITFNIFCLIAYYVIKAVKASRYDKDMEEDNRQEETPE